MRTDYESGAPSGKPASEIAARDALTRKGPAGMGLVAPHDLRKMELPHRLRAITAASGPAWPGPTSITPSRRPADPRSVAGTPQGPACPASTGADSPCRAMRTHEIPDS